MGLPWASSFLVTPTRAGNEPVEVKSCDELLGTIVPATEPAAPATARDYRVFVGVKLQCEAALELSVAKEAKVSFLDQFALDERVPHLFPKWLAIIVSPDDEERVKGSKYESWFDFEPVVSARDVTPQRGEFNSRGASQLIELVGKGDFNGDGIEDLLVTSRDSLTEGSYRAVRMFSLTRRGNQERLELLRQF